MAGDQRMQTLTFLFAFIAVLALIGVAAWLVRRFATNRLGANTNRGRMPRLAVIDAAAVDGRRRLVLVRRDNVEHLLMIGGPSDIVVEPNIVRAMPGRDQMAPRPAVGGEQPPRIAPLPDADWSDDAARADSDLPTPSITPSRRCPSRRRARRAPPSPTKSAARRRRRCRAPSAATIRLAGFAPEPMASAGPEPRPDPIPPRLTRTEPTDAAAAAPDRTAEGAAAGPRARTRRRAAATPAARACRRRPAPTRISPRWRSGWKPPCAGRPTPRSRRRSRPSRRPPARRAARRPPAPAPQKSGFENLEDEMASLLGRPKSPS